MYVANSVIVAYLLCQHLMMMSLINGSPSNFGNSMFCSNSTTLRPCSVERVMENWVVVACFFFLVLFGAGREIPGAEHGYLYCNVSLRIRSRTLLKS